MIKDFQARLYQESIFATCTTKNTLVVLPTGLGKTNIFLMIASHRLTLYPESKILFVGPTRPLIDQYYDVFLKHFVINQNEMCVLTGNVAPDKRAKLWEKSRIIFSTPQGLENDLVTNRISLADVSLLGIDEAHRAVGNYSYVWIADKYFKTAAFPRIVGLTASPGDDVDSIRKVCENLHLEEIESRSYSDPDVLQYVQKIDVEWRLVDLPDYILEIKFILEKIIREKIESLRKVGLNLSRPSKKELLGIQAALQGKIAQGEKDSAIWSAISSVSEAIKVYHALELLETQGVNSLNKYFERFSSESVKSKASRNLEKNPDFLTAVNKVRDLFEKGVEHPKFAQLKEIISEEVKKDGDIKVLIFAQYRDSASKIISELSSLDSIVAKIFVGQMKKGDTGMSQKVQKVILDEFREGKFNVLCATSIGEEGLDIPKVDLVVFFEPIPSGIRHIQRRGRTGRHGKGRVIVLVAKGTMDEAFRWISQHKEKKMALSINKLKGALSSFPVQKTQKTLDKFAKKIKIFADSREQGNSVLKFLSENSEISLQRLETADYICSSRVGVEVKKVSDFVDSIVDGRLLSQLRDLRKEFERPVIIIEGSEDIFSVRNVHANAIRGMLAAIAVSYSIPIINTKNSLETAAMISVIAHREQEEQENTYTPHKAKPLSLRESQEYVVSSLPTIGISLAKPLLRKFKTIKKIVNATEDDLKAVDLIGEKKAREIRKVLDSEYSD